MGRPSKLNEKQWEQIEKRLLAGESISSLAREFNVSKSVISTRYSERLKNVKSVANQIVSVEDSLAKMSFSERYATFSYADCIKAMNTNMAHAGVHSSQVAHRLWGVVSMRLDEIDDAKPMCEESRQVISDIAALGKVANMAAEIPSNLMRLSKEKNEGEGDKNAILLAELISKLPN